MAPTFTTLPLEIRHEIYRHVFDYDFITPQAGKYSRRLIFHPPPERYHGFTEKSNPQILLALLSVSQQVSIEAQAFFYGNTQFRGKRFQIVAFIKGIGPRRRDAVRSVTVSHPASLAFRFDNGETLEMLGLLPNLRTLRITASVRDFTRLQNDFVQGGLLKLAGKLDIEVCNVLDDCKLNLLGSPAGVRYRDEYIWSCAKDTTEWTGGELIRSETGSRGLWRPSVRSPYGNRRVGKPRHAIYRAQNF